ncbi:tryptophan-rich sensory protein [Brevibacillus brevis]|uniref:TspO/MBR family protein n=1 Tax=Brevibacillus brevis TaxID=1393 RepID=UPI001F2DD84E|nr:TspO/MBR family protein [Brevibacillus brevis]UIO43775.1 tryptophan-rich sensory protein [Brevibacillus brevis]
MRLVHNSLLFLAGVVLYSLGGIAFPDGGTWYDSLAKPDGTPPIYLFRIIWLILYALIAWSFVILIRTKQIDREFLLLYGINWFFHQLFFVLFIGYQLLVLAALDTILVMYSTWVLIRAIRPHHKIASSLLIPYFMYSVFFMCLAIGFCLLNL